MLVLDDGRVVFHRSMIHFSPTHAAALALYDPVSDREEPVYPPRGVGLLWERPESATDALADLLGRRRAEVLTELALP